MLTDCRVRHLAIDAAQGHRVSLELPGRTQKVTARWVVDASGRPGLLKRVTNLAEPSGHRANAAWVRVAGKVDVDSWSNAPGFLERIPRDLRWLSTNHLTGPGYWVWLIPLESGATSIGVVADATLHDFRRLRSPEALRSWLREHGPQCADAVEALPMLDFRVRRQFAQGCRQLFSTDRWCLVGDAGFFFDPLYSPGTDVIAITNSMITDLVARDHRGEKVAWALELADNFMRFYVPVGMSFFQSQYPLMGNPQVNAGEGRLGHQRLLVGRLPPCINGAYHRWELLPELLPLLARFSVSQLRAQEVLREWALTDKGGDTDAFVNINDLQLAELNSRIGDRLDDAQLLARVSRNPDYLEALLQQIESRAGAQPTGQASDPECNHWLRPRWRGSGYNRHSNAPLRGVSADRKSGSRGFGGRNPPVNPAPPRHEPVVNEIPAQRRVVVVELRQDRVHLELGIRALCRKLRGQPLQHHQPLPLRRRDRLQPPLLQKVVQNLPFPGTPVDVYSKAFRRQGAVQSAQRRRHERVELRRPHRAHRNQPHRPQSRQVVRHRRGPQSQ